MLFTEKNIFKILSKMITSMQSSSFNLIVLREAIERDFDFIVEEMLDGRIPVTEQMIEILLQNDKNRMLIELISIRKDSTNSRPKYFTLGKRSSKTGIQALLGTNKAIKVGDFFNDEKKDDELLGLPELSFDTIIHIALKIDTKTE